MEVLPTTPTSATLEYETAQKTSTTSTIWKGSRKLIEQPNSPAWTVGSPAKCQRVFVGPYTVAMNNWPLSGMTMRDMPEGWIIDTGATIVKATGGKGVVTIPLVSYAYAQSDFGKDGTEEMPVWSVERRAVVKNIENHPHFYKKVAEDLLEAIDEAINSKSAARAAAKTKFKDNDLAKELYNYRLVGTDSYKLWVPVCQSKYFTKYTGQIVPNDPGAGYWDDPGPSAPFDYYYLKTEGKLDHVWKDGKYYGWWTIEEWTGFDAMDTVLYPNS